MKAALLTFCLFASLSVFGYDWDIRADFGGVARHRTTALAIGNHVYFGLGHFNGAGPNILFEDWWAYDPATNSWTQKANYLGGPTYHAAGFTIDGLGYVGTGRIPGSVLVNWFYKYDPTTNTWTQLQNFPGSNRRGGVGFAIDGLGYLGTGTYTSDFYRYDPTTDSWTSIASLPTTGRISAVGFELDGYGYVGTGNVSGASNDFWRYDPEFDQWTAMAVVGPIPRQEASGFAVNGKGYILTGDNFSSGTNYGDMWEYDPLLNSWTQMDDFPGTARRYLSCVTLGNYAYAGLGTNGTNFKDFWIFDQVASVLRRNMDNIYVNAFPNPTTDYVQFEFGGLESVPLDEIGLTITSMTGQQVYSEFISETTVTVETKEFQKGQYIYNLHYKGRDLKNGKLIVQ